MVAVAVSVDDFAPAGVSYGRETLISTSRLSVRSENSSLGQISVPGADVFTLLQPIGATVQFTFAAQPVPPVLFRHEPVSLFETTYRYSFKEDVPPMKPSASLEKESSIEAFAEPSFSSWNPPVVEVKLIHREESFVPLVSSTQTWFPALVLIRPEPKSTVLTANLIAPTVLIVS